MPLCGITEKLMSIPSPPHGMMMPNLWRQHFPDVSLKGQTRSHFKCIFESCILHTSWSRKQQWIGCSEESTQHVFCPQSCHLLLVMIIIGFLVLCLFHVIFRNLGLPEYTSAVMHLYNFGFLLHYSVPAVNFFFYETPHYFLAEGTGVYLEGNLI